MTLLKDLKSVKVDLLKIINKNNNIKNRNNNNSNNNLNNNNQF